MNHQARKSKRKDEGRPERRKRWRLRLETLRLLSRQLIKRHTHPPKKSFAKKGTPDEIARRQALLAEVLAERAAMPPLGISTEELIRRGRGLASGS